MYLPSVKPMFAPGSPPTLPLGPSPTTTAGHSTGSPPTPHSTLLRRLRRRLHSTPGSPLTTSLATSRPCPTDTSPTTTLTSTQLYSAMMAIAIENRSVHGARAESALSNAARIIDFGAVLKELRQHLDDEPWDHILFGFHI